MNEATRLYHRIRAMVLRDINAALAGRNTAGGATATVVEGHSHDDRYPLESELDAHIAATGVSVHGLGSISTQSAAGVNITGGNIAGITDLAVADGGTGASTASGARTNLGLVIGTNVQAWDADLDAIAALAKTDGNIIVGNGSTWVAESGSTARTSLGLGTGDSPQFTAINLGHASDTTIARVSAGLISVEGVTVTLNTATQTLTNKTLTTPTIASFVNAQHNHSNAAGGGTIAHSVLIGIGANDHHNQSHVLASTSGLGADHTVSGLTARQVLRATSATTAAFGAIEDADIPSTIVRTSRTLTAGAGLTGGGDLTANRTFNVGAGAGITVNADDVALTTPGTLTASTSNSSSGNHTHAIDSTIARSAITLTAGAGLTGGGDLTANRTFNVGAGTLITVGATTVGIAAGTNYQFIGTGSGTAAGWRNVSELAGAGLTAATGILAVGAGAGITVNADDVALTTPGSVTVSSANSSSGNHTHAVVSSSNPGATASILATDSNGKLNLAYLGVNGLPGGSDRFNVTGHATLDSANFDGAVTIDDDLSVVYGGYYPLYVNVNTVTPGNSNVGIMKNNPDDQFALDIFGSMRVDGGWIVGKHALQLADAEMIVHFDGPTPFETNYSGFSAGHMGQVGTEAGGIIYRPGKFGKAVQVAEATTNRIRNPSCETNITGYNSASTGYTLVQSSEQAYIGTYSAKWTWGSGTANFYYNQSDTLANDTTFTVTIHAKRADGAAVSGVSMYIDGTLSTITPTITEVENGWYRIVGTRTITGAPGNHVVGLTGLTTTTSWYFDAWQVEAKSYATPYCDGSLGSGHSWSGTAHASTSSRTGATLRYANSLDVEIGTIALWVWHESNTTVGMGLFGTGANTQFDAYVNSAGAVYFRMAGVNLNSSANVVMRQWNHYAFTWSKADNARKIYLNGVEVASRQYDAGAIMGATLYALSLTAGSGYTINGYGDEFVHLRRAADAEEIRAIYESDAPVFAESSNFAFRAPSRSAVWVDEEGLWMRSYSGNDTFGIYAADATKSWGGLTLYDSDLAIGNSTAGYVHWHSGVDADDSTYYGNPALQIAARLHVKGNSTIDGSLTIGTGGYIASGATGYNSGTGLWLEYNGGTPRLFVGSAAGNKMTWDGSALTLVGGVTATTGAIGGWTIGATTLTGGNATLSSAGKLTLGTSNDVAIVDASDATYRLWVGHATAGSAPFRVTKAGALTASNANITGAITANSGSIAGALTIGGSGGIYQGTGSFGSPTTGLKIWNDGGIGRIAGYNSEIVQWYGATDGKLYAGAGAVTLDALGISITAGTGAANRISWATAGLQKGSLNVQTLANENYLFVNASGTDATDAQGRLYLSASPYNVAHKGARIEVYSAVSTSGTLHYGEAHHFYPAAGGSSLLTVDSSGVTIANAGLHILDTDASHDLIIAPGSNLTADRTLTVTTGDANRTLTLTGNATLNDWFDQAVKVASSPTFAGGKFTGRADFGPGGDTVNNALDDAVFGSTSGTGNGVTILTNTTSIGYVGFQDTSGLTPQGFVAYDHNIDALLFRANASEKQRILANGNVLIGTTTDSGYKLDVTGALRATGAAYLTDIRPVSDSTTAVQVKQAGGTAFVTFDSTNKRVGINRTPTGYDFEVTGNVYFDSSLDVNGNILPTGYVARTRTLNQSIAAGGNWDTGITVGADQFWIVRIMTAQTASGNIVDAAVWLIARQNTSYMVQRFGGTSNEHSVSLSSYAIRVTNTSAGTRYHSFSCARFL